MSNETNKALLLFSVGPVQSFIAASRKTLDLFSGSEFLSRITGAAIKGILNDSEIIFPFVENEEDLNQPLPNRFFALVDYSSATTLAVKAENAAREYINIEIKKARESVQGRDKDLDLHPWVLQWQEQSDAFWEFYYAFKAVDTAQLDNPAYYGAMYAEIEKLSGERKAVRDFRQLVQLGMKCNYFQGYSALFPLNHNGRYGLAKDFTKEHLTTLRPAGRYKSTEVLSALGFLKREFGWERQNKSSFPSTINLANGDFNRVILGMYQKDEELRKCLQNYNNSFEQFAYEIKYFPDRFSEDDINTRGSNYPLLMHSSGDNRLKNYLRFDNQFLLREELEFSRIKSEYGITNSGEKFDQKLKDLQQSSQGLVKYVKDNFSAEIKKYYAVLYFDGDNMGKWLSGSVTREVNGTKESFPVSLSVHKKISAALKDFALNKVRAIVEKDHLGQLVYAGGDDVIAFCTLSELLPIIKKIRTAFELCMNEATDNFAPATGSFGIAIAHWQHALQSVMNEARQAEKFAKNTLGRNAFGISVLKRSGEKYIAGANFDDKFEFVSLMESYIRLLNNEYLSTSFIYEFEREVLRLSPGMDRDVDGKLIMALFRYFLERKTESKSSGENKEEDISAFSKLVDGLISSDQNHYYEHTLRIISLLKTAQFMRRGND